MATILRGNKVKLETIDPKRAPLMNEWFNDPYITRNLNWGTFPMALASSREFAEKAQRSSQTDRHFSIIASDLPKEEGYIGHIGLHHIDWRNRHAELGIVIGKRKHLNKGYGKDAMKTLLHFAFTEMNLQRVMLRHYEFNDRGHHAYLKAGFKEEGRLRKSLYRHGKYWDEVLMGVLKEEYIKGN